MLTMILLCSCIDDPAAGVADTTDPVPGGFENISFAETEAPAETVTSATTVVTTTTEVTTTVPVTTTTTATTTTTTTTHVHDFASASCTAPEKCNSCGETRGYANGHNFADGFCTVCGAKDPNYVPEVMVWIPTNGGAKYHSRSGCSNMKNPEQVTKSEAINRGFGPCGRCY